MKQICTLAFLLLSMQLFAQSYPITAINISLPSNPDANTSKWNSGSGMLTISATARMINGVVDGRAKESRVLVTIKKNGAPACGSYTNSTAPASGFTTVSKVWNGTNAISLLGQDCTLPPGEYELCVQFFGEGVAPISLSEVKCTAFSIKAKDDQQYQPPQPLQPSNNASLTADDVKKPLPFRWTPLVPKPTEPVTYRLRVWQLMQGQNQTQAMNVNQPVIIKDIDNLTQYNVTNLLTGPCKPPYLCDFVWNVQALNKDGKPIGSNNGTSEPFGFTVSSKEEPTSPLKLIAPENGSTITTTQEVKFTWLPPTPAPPEGGGYKIKIVEIKGDESPENAMLKNKAFFEKEDIAMMKNKAFFEKEGISFQYPSSAPKFIEGISYAWQVIALDKNGRTVGGNNGTSETWKFIMATPGRCDINIDSVTYICKGYNTSGKPVYGFKIYLKNNSTSGVTNLGNTFSTDPNNGNAIPPTQNGTYLNMFPPTGGVISNLSPATTALTIIAPGSQQVITGDYTLNNAANKCITFKVFASTFITSGSSVTGNSCSSLKDTCLAACLCKDCDNITVNLNSFNTATPAGANQFNLSGSISVSVPVYAIELDVQSYSFSSTPSACTNGVTSLEQSGMLLMPGTTVNNNPVIQVYNENISGSSASNNNATKQVKLISTSPITGNIPLNLLIGLPGPIAGLEPGCCKMQYEVCIRIKVFYDEKSCKSCVFTKCIQF